MWKIDIYADASADRWCRNGQIVATLLLGMLIAAPVAVAETITQREWSKRLDGVCAYYNARYPTDPSTTAAGSMAFWAKHGSAEIRLDNRFQKQAEAIPLPVTGRTLAQTWLKLNREQIIWDKRFIAAMCAMILPLALARSTK